jgi:hypothetical protein
MNKQRGRNCKTCGETDRDKFYESIKGGVCKACFNQKISARVIQNKKRIVEYMGGKCHLCGYDKYIGALELHHLDPSKKDPQAGHIRHWSWERAVQELDKCILLCANCHAEVEGNYATLV